MEENKMSSTEHTEKERLLLSMDSIIFFRNLCFNKPSTPAGSWAMAPPSRLCYSFGFLVWSSIALRRLEGERSPGAAGHMKEVRRWSLL